MGEMAADARWEAARAHQLVAANGGLEHVGRKQQDLERGAQAEQLQLAVQTALLRIAAQRVGQR
jgi:hypothetical protein